MQVYLIIFIPEENIFVKIEKTYCHDKAIFLRNTFAGPSSIWFGGNSGFGGSGEQAATRCVRDGPFRRGVWNVVPSADENGCLRRQFNQSENAPNSIAVAAMLRFGPSSFFDFELTLRVFLHDPIHCLIGGTFSSTCRYSHGCIFWKLNVLYLIGS